jgi:hypothetical protein
VCHTFIAGLQRIIVVVVRFMQDQFCVLGLAGYWGIIKHALQALVRPLTL